MTQSGNTKKQSETRNPVFSRAEEYILKMVLASRSVAARLEEGDIIGAKLALGAITAAAAIAIMNLREGETGLTNFLSFEEIEAALEELEKKK